MRLGMLFVTLLMFAAAARGEIVDLKLKSGRVLNAVIKQEGPRERKAGQRKPVMLIFGGFQNAANVLELVHPTVPVILASFDYPFDPPRYFEFPGGMKLAPEAKRTIHETIEGIAVLVAYLKTRADVDLARMTIVGASLGAPFAAIAGANIPELRGVAIIHGFGEVASVISHQVYMKWRKKYGILARPMAWWLGTWAWDFIDIESPEDAMERISATQSVLMIEAANDTFVPKDASESLWEAIEKSKARKKKITHAGDHLQPGSDALISRILKMVQDWGIQEDLL